MCNVFTVAFFIPAFTLGFTTGLVIASPLFFSSRLGIVFTPSSSLGFSNRTRHYTAPAPIASR